MLNVLAAIAGVLLIGLAAGDALDTLVSNRVRWPGGPKLRLLWLTDFWLTLLWRMWSGIGRRLRPERRREAFLSTFAPLGLVSLVLLWMIMIVIGFGLVWSAFLDGVSGIDNLVDAIYFSGVVMFTVGFGEIVPIETAARFLALTQALVGVVFGAMVIGFLPALYGAYSERERQLLLLDDLSDERLTPVALLRAHIVDGDRTELDQLFRDWEVWTANLMESHLSYPMLMWFRSQQRGQSWITALGVVLDAAAIVLAITGERTGPAMRMWRRGTRAIDLLARRISLVPVDESRFVIDEAAYQRFWESLEDLGLARVSAAEARAASAELRDPYLGWLEALIDITLAPRGFWPSGGPLPREMMQAEIPIRHADTI